MTTVLVPAAAGVLSALGLVAADERRDAVRTYVMPLADAGELPPRERPICATSASRSSSRWRSGLGLAERFHDAHERAVRLRGSRPRHRARRGANGRGSRRRRRSHGRQARRSRARGPQVLELDGATAWVPAGWAGETDPHGTLSSGERRDRHRAAGHRRVAPRDRGGDGRRADPLGVLGEHQGASRLLDGALRPARPHGHAGGAHPRPSRRDARGGGGGHGARPGAGRAVDPQRPVRGRNAPARTSPS